MSRPGLPPYFLAVALASMLVCGAALAVQILSDDGSQALAPIVAMIEKTDQEPSHRPRRPKNQTIDFVNLRHDVEIKGTTLSRKKIRHRLRPFRRALERLEAQGSKAGIYLRDLSTDKLVTYGDTDFFYPASSIKGLYVVCVFERLVDTGQTDAANVQQLATPIIIESDNDAYRTLRATCGNEVFAQWAVDCGAIREGSKSYDRYMVEYYPRCTPRQMGILWEQAFSYLDTPSESTKFLTDLFDQRVESPMRKGLPSDLVTISKAGWYPAEEGKKYTATADAGIVLDGEHAYVLVVMTDIPDDLEKLAKLMRGIWSASRVLE